MLVKLINIGIQVNGQKSLKISQSIIIIAIMSSRKLFPIDFLSSGLVELLRSSVSVQSTEYYSHIGKKENIA